MVGILPPLTLGSSTSHALQIQKPSFVPSDPPSVSMLKEALSSVAVKYGLDYDQMSTVVSCESGWRIDPPHNNISWGIAQFTPATWKDYGTGDIMNPYMQLEVMGKMWKKGLMGRWDCYRILY